MNRFALVTCLSFAACSASSVGGGTQRLFVEADLDGDGTEAGSRIVVQVRKGNSAGELLSDAAVIIRGGSLKPTTVPFDAARNDYRLEGFRWVPAMRLEVTREREWLDASIDVPGATLLANPLQGSNFVKANNQPLIIEWRDEHHIGTATTSVHLQRSGIDRTIPPGTSSMVVELDELTRAIDETVRVERRVTIEPFGGAMDSRFSAGTSNTVTFNIQ